MASQWRLHGFAAMYFCHPDCPTEWRRVVAWPWTVPKLLFRPVERPLSQVSASSGVRGPLGSGGRESALKRLGLALPCRWVAPEVAVWPGITRAEGKVRVSASKPPKMWGRSRPGSQSAGSRGPRFARVPCFPLLSPCHSIC